MNNQFNADFSHENANHEYFINGEIKTPRRGANLSDYAEDARREKWLEEKEAIRQARRDYCERDCEGHNEGCPYYDETEETFDFEECFRDRGGF